MEGPPAGQLPELDPELIAQLSPRAAIGLLARAGWRSLPGFRFDPEQLQATAAALALADLYAIGREPRQADQTAALINRHQPALPAAHYSAWLIESGDQEFQPKDAHNVLIDTIVQAEIDVDSAMEAARNDLLRMRDWASSKRAADGIPGTDQLRAPLWARPETDAPPERWLAALEDWSPMASEYGLEWLPRQLQRLLKGGGVDLRAHGGYLEDWAARFGDPPPEPGKKSAEAEPDKLPDEDPDDDQPPAPELTGGIVTARADQPATEDHLGRKPLVETLADMLASPDQGTPMTIALLGDWGAGKTSVIEQLKQRLREIGDKDESLSSTLNRPARKNRFLFATFNAWEYEQTDNIRAGLAQEVVNGLTRGLSRSEKLLLAVHKAHRDNFWEFWQAVGGFVLGAIGIAFGINLATPEGVQQALSGANLIGGGGLTALGGYLLVSTLRNGKRLLEHPMASQLATYLKLPSYGKHLGEVPLIKKEIKGLCTQRLAELPNGRLLVFVDDLDRCHPGAVIEALDAIRLVMNLDNVVIIIAIDDRIAFRAVAEHYKELAETGKRSKEDIARDYLGKIIQLPVNLYDPWPAEVGQFVDEYLFQVADEDKPDASGPQHAASPQPATTSPAVSRYARPLIEQHRLDATLIAGSGENGRILKRDVESYLEQRRQEPAGAPTASVAAGGVAPGTADPTDSAYSAEQQQQIEDFKEEQMRDTADERDLFATLAGQMDFHNPRQLIRLRNSYRLLKGYQFKRDGHINKPRAEQQMHCLFWYEYLYQLPADARHRAEYILWHWPGQSDWHKPPHKTDPVPPAIQMARWIAEQYTGEDWAEQYHHLMRTVEMAVLPNAQVGLLLTSAQVSQQMKAEKFSIAECRPWLTTHG